MRCPFCGYLETQVKDSRPAEDSAAIRRRRSCPSCGARFTSYERVQLRELMVRKSNGEVEVFARDKLYKSMFVALKKRPIDDDKVERTVNSIIRQLELLGENEIPTDLIGKKTMDALYSMDRVAYVRYASVYQDFRDTGDFTDFIRELQSRLKEDMKAISPEIVLPAKKPKE
ncbi:MAG: ATP-cone domain protein [Alphaproteobacteria bacterium]|nr:ATP-cone domain protein [Alphaproteobacteria bacterium]